MKTVSVVIGALLSTSLVGSLAQTTFSASDFSLPPMVLRTELTLDAPPPAVPSPFPAHELDTNSPSRDVSASTPETATALQSYNARADRFYLVPTPEQASASPAGRALNSIAQPEIVRLGNKPVECSVVTAVKRKNPLCLINATIFKMTW